MTNDGSPEDRGQAFDRNLEDDKESNPITNDPVALAEELTSRREQTLEQQLEDQIVHNEEEDRKERAAQSKSQKDIERYEKILENTEEVEEWSFDLSTPAAEFSSEELTHESDRGIRQYMEAQASEVSELSDTIGNRSEMMNEAQNKINEEQEEIKGIKESVEKQMDGMDDSEIPDDQTRREFRNNELESRTVSNKNKIGDLREEISTDAETKQEAVDERSTRRSEAQEVHSEYAEQVESVVGENFRNIRDTLRILNSLSMQQDGYNENSVAASDENRTLNQGQREVVDARQEAGMAQVAAGLSYIDELESAVSDYDSVTDEINEELDIETRDIEGLYDAITDLGSINDRDEIPEDDEYGAEVLRQRVKEAAEGLMDEQYDSIAEIREVADDMFEEGY